MLSEVPEDAELTAELVLGNGDSVTPWPVHEVGRNPDIFDELSGRLLKAGSSIVSDSVHLHSNGRDTKAHLEIGFKFHPKGYKPTLRRSPTRQLRQRRRHRHQADGSRPAAARLHRAAGAHQDHVVRAAPARAGRAHVPRSDLGLQHPDAQLRRLRPQLGARLRLRRRLRRRCCRRARSCTSSATWTTRRPTRTCPTRATGRARATGRSRTCSSTSAWASRSPTSSSRQEMMKRREQMKLTQQDVFIGCPLCNVAPRLTPPTPTPTTDAPTPPAQHAGRRAVGQGDRVELQCDRVELRIQ